MAFRAHQRVRERRGQADTAPRVLITTVSHTVYEKRPARTWKPEKVIPTCLDRVRWMRMDRQLWGLIVQAQRTVSATTTSCSVSNTDFRYLARGFRLPLRALRVRVNTRAHLEV
jgi:hypothetical protein